MIRLLIALSAILVATSSNADEDEHDRQDDDSSRKATITHTIQLKIESKSDQCHADANLDYFQRGIEVQVETVIDTQECEQASGEYVVKVTVLSDTQSEVATLSFEDSWEQADGLPAESMRRYPIGNDVELKKVRIRKLSCMCAVQDE